ncbi:hypothetical protein IJ425_00980 [bacterium]|nr:hypothetical protein [bacterium]
MNKIIIISGKQYSGKDTVAKILLDKLDGFKRVGIGDAIKLEYGRNKGLSFDEIESNKHLYRADLIELGNYGRSIDCDYWLKNLAGMDKIIVPDVRLEHELNFFKSRGAFLLRVESSEENRAKRGVLTNADDYTETALDSYSGWDFIIDNNLGYSELVGKADEVVNVFNKFIDL